MEIDEIETQPNILYERLALAEWHQSSDTGLQKISLNNSISNSSSYFNPWRIFEKSKLDKQKFLQTSYTWQLAVSPDGKVIAVIQDSQLEIRTAKDEYSTVVGKAPISGDQYPQLRKALWSGDNTFLAVARDNGTVNIFNLLGCIVASIQPFVNSGSIHAVNSSTIKPVVGLVFLQPKLKTTKWSNELFVFYNDGEVRSIFLSLIDGCDSEENVNCSLEQYFPQGITAIASHSLHHVIAIAGNSPTTRDGISVWRVLNDYPYLKIASGFEKDTSVARSFLRLFSGYSGKIGDSAVIKMKISPKGEMLACMHYSGDISLWQFPGVRLLRRWSLSEQRKRSKINPQNSGNVKDAASFHPVDICWWSNTALAVARKSGAITVCSLTKLDNLLGESPEFFGHSPQISSVCGLKSTVIVLECETENNRNKIGSDAEGVGNEHETSVLQASIQAALYSFTDIEIFEPKRKTPRFVQRTYRLVALKSSTPDELYIRKIELEDYESALQLAHTYNLDCDLVYQKQWKSVAVSKESIHRYLRKIKDTQWVINECIRRVPDTSETAKVLLEFGLNKTELDHESINYFDSKQKKIISSRRQILSFLDNLILYMKIINDPAKYNAVEYDEFRRKCPVVNTINLARDGNWLGVSIMFTYMGNVVLKYWLPILSNFSETLPPPQYRSLLPEVKEEKVVAWDIHPLRVADWSEDDKYKQILAEEEIPLGNIYQDDPTLRYFEADTLTPCLVEQWYRRRVYEIEKNTGMVNNAYLLTTLATERKIQGLDMALFNLKTLYFLVYVIQIPDVTLAKLESLTVFEQAKLFLTNTTRETFVEALNEFIQPFSMRCEKQRIGKFREILQYVLVWKSEENLDYPLEFFKACKEDHALTFALSLLEIMRLAILCVYSCKAPDQLDNGYSILECLPVRTGSESPDEVEMHNKVDNIENHLEVCDILQNYRIYKTPVWVLENEGDNIVAAEIMQRMADHTSDSNLNFDDLEFDLQQIQALMCTSLEPEFSSELVAYTQLLSVHEETVQAAVEYLQTSNRGIKKNISFERSVELAVKASRTHFHRATSLDHFEMGLAHRCLSLIRERHPLIVEEYNLIESIDLLREFQVPVLPTQVRNCPNRMKIVEYCLQSKDTAYRDTSVLMQIADVLQIYGPDKRRRECEVLLLSSKYGLQMEDLEFCRGACNELVSRRFPQAWPLAVTLIFEDERIDERSRNRFLSFAILHCPKSELRRLTDYRRSLRESRSLRETRRLRESRSLRESRRLREQYFF